MTRAVFVRNRRVISVRDQAAVINLKWPTFRSEIKGGRLVCVGDLQPSSSHLCYRTRVSYAVPQTPNVMVVSPSLQPRIPGGRVEHTYSDGSICAFHPSDWRPDRYLALTVLPWACRWLHVYEVWLVTGEWDAHGIHPSQP